MRTKIQYLKGVGERRAELFARLGISTVFDLLRYFPRDYEDRRRLFPIAAAPIGEPVCIDAIVASPVHPRDIRRGFSVTKVRAVDETGGVTLVFFNQKYSVAKLSEGERYVFFGKLERTPAGLEMKSPLFETAESDAGKTRAIVPVYSLTAGLSGDALSGYIRRVLAEFSEYIPEVLPEDVRLRNTLAHTRYSYEQIHFPKDETELELARRRMIFEEFFILSLGLLRLKSRRENDSGTPFRKLDIAPFERALPFSLTAAQKRVIGEAMQDMSKDVPMNRILQGDVGSGKTAVAAACAYLAHENGFQTALMVPTEILAEQHTSSLSDIFGALGMRVGLLTGSMSAAQKRKVKESARDGELDVIIGTHAIITEDTDFAALGLVIADEQHRFGVRQRAALAAKGKHPHQLVMSATPIPRSLALIMYGDLDISVIDELPPGRLPVDTLIVSDRKRDDAYAFIRKQLDLGGQAYVVCPLIDEDEENELRSVEKFAQELSHSSLEGYKVEFIHGRLKQKEKDAIMRRFVSGETKALVSTTVIEVGVNVPNATVMAVENAERFGLSQLHQLRGRVGRGERKSYCILFSNAARGSTAAARLQALQKTNDGFRIAEEDLKLRGPGDFFGTRQHGLPQLKIASLSSDMRVLDIAKREAAELLREDSSLSRENHRALRERIEEMFDTDGGEKVFN